MNKKNSKKGTQGFTLAETMLATLILLMVTTIVATGIPVARNAYEEVVLASNAELLLSTTVTTLRNELGAAKEIVIIDKDGKQVVGTGTVGSKEYNNGVGLTYLNKDTGSISKIWLADTNKYKDPDGQWIPSRSIIFQRYASTDQSYGEDTDVERLISKAVSTKDLYVVFKNVSYSELTGIVTFSGLKVYNANSGKELISRGTEGTFSVRNVLN